MKRSKIIKNRLFAFLLALPLTFSAMTEPVMAGVHTESSVTQEMCSAAYWNARAGADAAKLLMTQEQIAHYNAAALAEEECHMNDLLNMDALYDATKLKNNLADSLIKDMPNKDIYVNGTKADTKACYEYLSECVRNSGWDGSQKPFYALAVSQTQIRNIPTAEYIGYSAADTDDEAVLSSLRVNEPFVIKQFALVNGRVFFWGYSDNVSGWVDALDVAVCSSRNEWLDMWKPGTDPFIVVTTGYFYLSQSHYSPATSELMLTMGTTLKLVPENELPQNIAGRGTWNNYAVYVPTRGANGECVRQIALIGQNKKVSEGYLPMTAANIVSLSFEYLGDTYGWGGMLDSVDCSAFVRNVYKCFGLDMPRNTNWQKCVPGTSVDVSTLDDAQKAAAFAGCLPGMPLYMSGHTMIYLGTVDGVNYVISALGSVADSSIGSGVMTQNSVAITPLTVHRRNGTTWLTNINAAVMPWMMP
ncbi:MAG: C40 family peptidase [Lachnospiraceae bacterium]|nr:C40 family peptidase [Lachnospiraceae bacterium]